MVKRKKLTPHDVFCAVVYAVGMAVLLYCLASCGVHKPVIVSQKDSIRVEIRERIVRDTAYVQIPAQFSSIITRDTVSVIELKFAKSTAAVRDGFLEHSLETTPDTVKVPVYIHVHDTTRVEIKGDTEYVEVERQPTKWENFLEVCGWIFLGCIALAVIAIILRISLHQ